MSITTGVGLISGIDYESIIARIAAASRGPIQIVQQKQAVYQAKSDAFSGILTRLNALRDQLRKMLTADDLTFRSAASSNDGVVTVSGGERAAVGSYSVRVYQLAQAHRVASQGVDSLNASIAASDGSVTIQVGNGASVTYDVHAGMTLAELRDTINQDPDGKVTASIVNDGTPTNPYRLVLSSKQTGAANAIAFVANDTTLDFQNRIIEAATSDSGNSFDGTVASSGAYTGAGTTNAVIRITEAGAVDGAAKFVVSLDGGLTYGSTVYSATSTAQDVSGGLGIQVAFGAGTTDFAVGDAFRVDAFDPEIAKASDAVISVDGIQISRSSNTFDDVIEGLTLTARSVSENPAIVTMRNEPGLLNAEVIKFQSAFNELVQTARGLAAYDTKTNEAQPLFGDSATRALRNGLARIITTPVKGIGSAYTTLASLGLSLQADGTLGFDSAKMNKALDEDVGSVMKIFGRIGDSTSSLVRLVDASEKTQARAFRVEITAAAARAAIDGNQALQSSGLAADEHLTFTFDERTFVVALSAGDKIDAVVGKINSAFSAEGVGLEASNESGILRIATTDYGSSAKFSVASDRSGATAAQLGFGTTQRNASGVDVAGTINGEGAIGEGRILRGITGGTAEGLELEVTATGPMTATVTYTRGVADGVLDFIEEYVDGENGIIKARQDGMAGTIGDLNDRIQSMEDRITREGDRLRRQFLAMEKVLAQYQGIGDYISNTLAQMSSIYGSRK
jgi:flagellar hook-associated protein 2